jgi:amino acid adenylation domain-containing protein
METDRIQNALTIVGLPGAEVQNFRSHLPEGLRAGEQGNSRGSSCEKIQLRTETLEALQVLAVVREVDLGAIFSAAWGVLLSKYSGQDDVLFGFLNRENTRSFSGMGALRLHIGADEILKQWLPNAGAALRAQQRPASPDDPLPFETALIYSAGEPGPLYDPASLPLTVHVYQSSGRALQMVAIGDPRRLREGGLSRVLRYLSTLLDSMAASPEARISALAMMPKDELEELLIQRNATEAEYPKDSCIHHLFEEQADSSPDATAAIFEGRRLSYRELDNKANHLAAQLQKLGAGPDVVVAICIERSLDMMVALFGVLKAGAAYLPLDPAFPTERLEFLLQDSQARILVTQERLANLFPQKPASTVIIDSGAAQPDSPERVRAVSTGSRNLAYLIYTSGSTGKPKGVMVEHQQAVNFFTGMDRLIGSKPGVWLAVTSISFDISIFELLWTLTRGFTVVVQSESERLSFGEHSIAAQIVQYGVTHMQCTPSLARFLMVDANSRQSLGHLRTLMLGGEALPAPLASQIRQVISGEFFNLYGPTETTIWSAGFRVVGDEKNVPIGRPIANTQIYILNHRLEPVPSGTPGELYIGGDGVARGYLNQPALTRERFLPNPFRTGSQERIYKTGDLARYRPDGDVEYLGRIDNQIKILGFRIEPEEIEAVLNQHPGVAAAAVIARQPEGGDMQLEAYIARGETPPEIADLRAYLEGKLPPQMCPGIYVMVDSLPVTPNGKIDKQALLARDPVTVSSNKLPASGAGLEVLLQTIWREALDLDEGDTVSSDDNFFDFGASSLMVAEVAIKLREALGREIPLTDLFQYPTIRTLTEHLSPKPDADRDEETPRRALTRAQFRKQALAGRMAANATGAQTD